MLFRSEQIPNAVFQMSSRKQLSGIFAGMLTSPTDVQKHTVLAAAEPAAVNLFTRRLEWGSVPALAQDSLAAVTLKLKLAARLAEAGDRLTPQIERFYAFLGPNAYTVNGTAVAGLAEALQASQSARQASSRAA